MESDLHTLSGHNHIFKFANDTNLLVPEHSDVSILEEITNLQDWAHKNKMILNFSKTKEMVFRRPHPNKFSIVPSIDGIESVRQTKLLGVVLHDNLSFEEHVNAVLTSCSQPFLYCENLT